MNIFDAHAVAKLLRTHAPTERYLHKAFAEWLENDTQCDIHKMHKMNCECRREAFDKEEFLDDCKPEYVTVEPGHTRLCMIYDGNHCDCWRDPRSKFYRKPVAGIYQD